MLPKINGKSFLECTEEDLKILIDNPDFRENEYIDYKQNFAFLELPKGKERNEKIAEFKMDTFQNGKVEAMPIELYLHEEGEENPKKQLIFI